MPKEQNIDLDQRSLENIYFRFRKFWPLMSEEGMELGAHREGTATCEGWGAQEQEATWSLAPWGNFCSADRISQE